jgi:NhaP-type Na+/H+ or K+/H+ antiporter
MAKSIIKKNTKNQTFIIKYLQNFLLGLHLNVQYLNNSKLFAGIIVITLNIASKFVNFKLSKSIESYLKNTFSRNILVFCIAWMGCREIYIALIITAIYMIFMDILFNDESKYYILPNTFKEHYISRLDETSPTTEEIKNAENILKRADFSKKNG